MASMETNHTTKHRESWNKGKLIGQQAPFKPNEIWAIRIHLQVDERIKELAPFILGINSKLRACDLTALHVQDVCHGDRVAAPACVLQRKIQRPVQLEITQPAKEAVEAWIRKSKLQSGDYLFTTRIQKSAHIGERHRRRAISVRALKRHSGRSELD
jgi:hypothetical protein